MKYLSLLLVGVIVVLSWFMTHKDQSLTSGEKQRLLGVIEGYMTQKVLEKEPNAKEIKFADLRTVDIEEGKTMKAYFKFSYLQTDSSNQTQRVHRKGHFLVASADGSQWRAQIDDIGDVQVEFMDALEISGDKNAVPEEEDSDTSAPETSDSNQ